MKKNEKKQQDQDVKVYDFRHCNEEISIGIFADSDLSKTLANYIYRHTRDFESEEFARELFHKGYVSMNEQTRKILADNIDSSDMIVSVKHALIKVLNSQQ